MRIKIDYLIDNANLTDEEYSEQNDKTVYIDKMTLLRIMEYSGYIRDVNLKEGDEIDIQNVTVEN